MRKSFKKAECHEVAAAILFIAGKLGSGGNFVSIEKVVHFMARHCCKDPALRAALDTSEGGKVRVSFLPDQIPLPINPF